MAKVELKFLDNFRTGDYLKVNLSKEPNHKGIILIEAFDSDLDNECSSFIYLDKSTAIKFAKTLRTEINKIEN